MPTIPRIARAIPRGSITTPEHPIPVLACIRWHDGRDMDLPAIAVAWTREAVRIQWDAPSMGMQTDWVPAEDVRRSGDRPAPPATPSTRGRTKRPRW